VNVAEMLRPTWWRRDPPRPWHSAEYCTYLDSREWRTMREMAFRAHGRACQECGAMRQLSVHHVHYRTLGHERIGDLSIICKYCHIKADRERRARGSRRA
jgi:5-methylcytosine-specific restriction endonuclease McrA